MRDTDTRLAGLALSWLITRKERRGTRKELETALFSFVEHRLSRAEWKDRCGRLVAKLEKDGSASVVGRQGASLELTEGGRAKGLGFLGLDAPPKGLTWKKVKSTHLVAISQEMPPTKATLDRLSKADGMRALLLKRKHGIEGEQAPTLVQVRDRLLWQQLGVDTNKPFTLKAVQAHLLGKLLGTTVSDPTKAMEQLTARAAGAARPGAEAVRMAALRDWALDAAEPATSPEKPSIEEAKVTVFSPKVTAPEPSQRDAPVLPINAGQTPTEQFAEQVLRAARALPDARRVNTNKVLIAHVWKALQPEWSNREAFNAALLEANRARRISLTRADIVANLDPRDVAESEVTSFGATFHFVVVA